MSKKESPEFLENLLTKMKYNIIEILITKYQDSHLNDLKIMEQLTKDILKVIAKVGGEEFGGKEEKKTLN